MVVRKITRGKRKGMWGVYHCHGKKKGKLIKAFRTKKKALAMHRAIILSKKRRKKKRK
ncbi:MAG: hypothetical protein ACTSWZ_05240 [Candidatus Heimdallarchaeaceae archaeon]